MSANGRLNEKCVQYAESEIDRLVTTLYHPKRQFEFIVTTVNDFQRFGTLSERDAQNLLMQAQLAYDHAIEACEMFHAGDWLGKTAYLHWDD